MKGHTCLGENERDLEQGSRIACEKDDCCCASSSQASPDLMELAPSEQSLTSTNSSIRGTIAFRPLQQSDRDHVQDLHEEWFPVQYKDEFYDELVHQRMVTSGDRLFTCAAIYHADEQAKRKEYTGDHEVEREESPLIGSLEVDSHQCESDTNERLQDLDGQIVSCLVGTFLDISKLGTETMLALINDRQRFKRVFYIMTLGTVDEFRHCRLGTALVNKCIDMVQRDDRCGAVYLHVITFNHAAIRFYEKLGFYRVKEIKDYYRIGEDLYNCYLYAKYFHGNRGEWDMYYHLSRVVSSVWERVTAPLSKILPSSRRVAQGKRLNKTKI